jgi:hypothetical protein
MRSDDTAQRGCRQPLHAGTSGSAAFRDRQALDAAKAARQTSCAVGKRKIAGCAGLRVIDRACERMTRLNPGVEDLYRLVFTLLGCGLWKTIFA